MNHLSFQILPCKNSNDYQTRVLVDGRDILLDSEFDDALGIDPVELFAQEQLFTEGSALIGRCCCGCIGCCDEGVYVRRQPDCVEWEWGNKTFFFDCDEYDSVLRNARADTAWESPERTAERLVSQIDFSKFASPKGLPFQWASSRCREGKMVLSYGKGKEQVLIDVNWTHEQTAASAVNAVLELLRQLTQHGDDDGARGNQDE